MTEEHLKALIVIYTQPTDKVLDNFNKMKIKADVLWTNRESLNTTIYWKSGLKSSLLFS